MGVEAKLVEKSGAWYSYDGERIGQGKENARQYLKENPAVMTKLETTLRAQLVAGCGVDQGSQSGRSGSLIRARAGFIGQTVRRSERCRHCAGADRVRRPSAGS